MLCPPGRPLNASATGAGLPDAHRDRPSREAGSFDGSEATYSPSHDQRSFATRTLTEDRR